MSETLFLHPRKGLCTIRPQPSIAAALKGEKQEVTPGLLSQLLFNRTLTEACDKIGTKQRKILVGLAQGRKR